MSSRPRIPRAVLHGAIVLLVFGITGAITVVLSRLLLGALPGVDGSLRDGPCSYRAAYVLLITPTYSATLIAVGSLFGKRAFFQSRVVRMWGLLLPKRWTAPRP